MYLCSGEGIGPRRSGDSWELEGTLLRPFLFFSAHEMRATLIEAGRTTG